MQIGKEEEVLVRFTIDLRVLSEEGFISPGAGD